MITRRLTGMMVASAGALVTLGSLVMGGTASASPVSTQTVALHNSTAERGSDCPDHVDDYWHFVIAPNTGYHFVSMTLNLGSTTINPTLVGGGIIKNGSQDDNVFVKVPNGSTLTSLKLSGSSAVITPAGGRVKFNLSHTCDGSGGSTSTSAPTTTTPHHCTTTTTTLPPTTTEQSTTTTAEATTTTAEATTTTAEATTTTAEATTTTAEATTTTAEATTTTAQATTTTAEATTTTAQATTTTGASGGPTTTAKATTTTEGGQSGGPTTTKGDSGHDLPSTGGNDQLLLILGLGATVFGLVLVSMTRRTVKA